MLKVVKVLKQQFCANLLYLINKGVLKTVNNYSGFKCPPRYVTFTSPVSGFSSVYPHPK
jgi:hypothetical protein